MLGLIFLFKFTCTDFGLNFPVYTCRTRSSTLLGSIFYQLQVTNFDQIKFILKLRFYFRHLVKWQSCFMMYELAARKCEHFLGQPVYWHSLYNYHIPFQISLTFILFTICTKLYYFIILIPSVISTLLKNMASQTTIFSPFLRKILCNSTFAICWLRSMYIIT